MPILSILLILPVVFTAAICALPAAQARIVGLLGAAVTFAASLLLLATGNPAMQPWRFEEKYNWIPGLGISYHVAADGPGILLILLTTGLQLLATLYAYNRPPAENPRAFFAWLMVLETAMIGAFCAIDLILFYGFFELCLVPAYFLIGMWGGRRRIAAATKFFVYTVVGSLLMLASIIGARLFAGSVPSVAGAPVGSFDYTAIHAALMHGAPGSPLLLWLFVGFAIAFAVKAGVFPFHTWLPDTYAEAPTPVVVLLSGVMAKLGTYGLYRFCIGLFGDPAFGPDLEFHVSQILVTLGVISIIYGALIAAVQTDLKRVLAYSSISHLGFVTLGLFAFTPYGLTGALLQMLNHGITSGALFLIAGMIEARTGTTSINRLGGLWEQMPLLGRFFLIGTLSSIALPLTNGFIGEFMILLGAYQRYPVAAGIATTGVIWSAVYMLYMFQRVMYGPVEKASIRRLHDIGRWETGLLAVFVILIFGLGIYPTVAVGVLESSVAPAVGGAAEPPAVANAARHGAIPVTAELRFRVNDKQVGEVIR